MLTPSGKKREMFANVKAEIKAGNLKMLDIMSCAGCHQRTKRLPPAKLNTGWSGDQKQTNSNYELAQSVVLK